MAENENTTGRLATCAACVERRIHTDVEWAVHASPLAYATPEARAAHEAEVETAQVKGV